MHGEQAVFERKLCTGNGIRWRQLVYLRMMLGFPAVEVSVSEAVSVLLYLPQSSLQVLDADVFQLH